MIFLISREHFFKKQNKLIYMKRKNFYFASANTGDGFVNFLDKIAQDGFMYIIKGGPGTGKSTMMKKIAQHFWEAGNSIEYYYCSTDPESLDGIRIVDKNVAIVDGTAPHIVNPQIVGVTHKILDVGQFVGNILKHKETLENLTLQKGNCFKNMYGYLSAARQLDDINFDIAKSHISEKLVAKKAKDLFAKIKKFDVQDQNKTLFLQSINTNLVDLGKQNKFKKVVFLAGRYEAFMVFEALSKMLQKNKICHTKILDSLNSKFINAIVLNNKIIIKNIKNNIKTNKKIENNNILIKNIVKNASAEVGLARQIHKKLEEIYVPNVDFAGLENLSQKTIEEIEKLKG